MLGAQWQTISAFGTGWWAFLLFLRILPLAFDYLIGFEHAEFVPKGEIAGDINAKRAGHAIFAAGASIAHPLTHG